ncbi:signal peptidase I [Hymenobacter sp. BT559]|uniref:signal peptidase I n=1 Tax=Hymenobacter sp. BT559 TaxID=2795729 RepID=UPI0018EAE9FB|nr:signal peptidase I [Hymenobacter sp. BT559]MBJ6142567.1 signal peptidase I [Hymenobacter sp. BT559]
MLFSRFNRPLADKLPAKPKSQTREWANSLLFAVVVATLIRWSAVEAYVIPSESMEHTLLVGDYLLVSKLHYGPITPQTPLQVPLTHQTLPVLDLPSYSDLSQLPTYRFPGFSSVQRNDVVVFHVPHEQQRPADLRTFLIKRCVAVAGDTLSIRQGQVFLNGRSGSIGGQPQTTYFMAVAHLNDEVRQALHDHQVVDYTQPDGVPAAVTNPETGKTGYYISCPADVAAFFRRQPYVQALSVAGGQVPANTLFPDAADFHVSAATSAAPRGWQLDEYGPLPVPKKGQLIKLTPANAAVYYKIVAQYEHNAGITWKEGMIQQNGQPLTQYTIKQNYYFMMGDNRHNSEDSRFWGFVPEDHIMGKAVLVWLSIDPHADLLHKIRWDRLLRFIS